MTDLEALVVAAYVFADEYPVPARGGRSPLVSDAELVALAVCQAAIGISSDRQFLGLVSRLLPGSFPHLPDQSQYNRGLRALVELISIVQQRLARWLDSGGVRVSDGTLIAAANYPGCQRRRLLTGTPAAVVVADKGFWGRDYARRLAATGMTLLTPERTRTASNERRERTLASTRLAIESVFSNLKTQMRLEHHLARTPAGLALLDRGTHPRAHPRDAAQHAQRRPARALAAYDGR
jgi:hypothetical protein